MSNFKRKVNIVESTTPPTNPFDWWYDLNSEVLKKPVNGTYVSISNGEPSGPAEEEETYAGVIYFTGSEESEDDIAHMRLYDNGDIPREEFKNRSDITSAIVLDGTKRIDNQAFCYCENLKAVKLPNSIISLELQAFYNCKSLQSLHLPNSLEEIVKPFPTGKDCLLHTITGKYTVDNTFVVKDNSLYYTCPYREFMDMDESLTIPQVETLKNSSVSVTAYSEVYNSNDDGEEVPFYYGAAVELPDSLQHIADGAFGYGCSGIASISGKYSRDGIFVIKDGKLYVTAGCRSYDDTDIIIPNDVTVIGTNAILGHHTVSNIYLSDSVETIQGAAIGQMDRHINIYINNVEPPVMEKAKAIQIDSTIYVPSSAVDTYKKATNWSYYADQIIGYDFN